MKEMGFGDGYRYAHDEPSAFAAGESYLPPEMKDTQYYMPNERGLEIKLKAKLDFLTDLNNKSAHKRYK